MYAETFNVRPWLEEPAKWLRWAQQSLANRKLDDTRYNLQQFWNGLNAYKAKASTKQDWAEILTLDAQSQLLLGNLYGADLLELLQTMNNTRLMSSSIYAVKEDEYKAKQRSLTSAREKALKASSDLASQASEAYRAASVPVSQQQADNTKTVSDYSLDRSKADAAFEKKMSDRIKNDGAKLTDLLTMDLLGIPGWAWITGGVLLILLITTGPAMAQGYAMRRALED